jgi:hypothetical protein
MCVDIASLLRTIPSARRLVFALLSAVTRQPPGRFIPALMLSSGAQPHVEKRPK